MATDEIRLVTLSPMRVASAYGFGLQPEEEAWIAMSRWAQPLGLLADLGAHPLFGFNNPYPTPTCPRYGYVFWLGVGPEIEPSPGIRIEEFFGGTYAVARCEVKGDPAGRVPQRWQSLAEWCNVNNHPLAHHPALEHFLSLPDDLDNLVVDLHCPVVG